jgi:hypothetical protein
MMKRILYILLIVGAIGSIVYVYLKLGAGSSDIGDGWDLVPDKASVVISLKCGSEGTAGREWLNGYQRTDDDLGFPALLGGLNSMLRRIDSLSSAGGEWNKFLNERRLLAYNRSAVSAESWVLIIPDGSGKESEFSQRMSDLTGPSVVQSELAGLEVFSSGSAGLSVTRIGNCYVMSTSSSALEDAIRNGERDDDQLAARTLKRARQQVAVDSQVQMFFRDDNDWWHLDLVNVEGAYQLAGFVHISDSTSNLVSFTGSGSQPGVLPLIPDHTELFEVRNYANFEEGWNMAGAVTSGTNEEAYWSRAWGDIGDSCACDLNEAVLNWRAGEWGSFMVPFDGTAYSIDFIKSTNDANALQMLRPVLGPDSLMESGYAIHSVKYPEAFQRNAKRYFNNHAAYILVYGGYVFLSAERDALAGLIKAIVARDTWEGMALWQDAFQKLGDQSGQLYFQDMYSISLLPESFVNCFGSARPIIASISRMKQDLFRANVLLGASSQSASGQTGDSGQGDKWTVRLGNRIRRAPQLVKNHKSGGFDVVVQTEDNYLRCIDASGTELWSHPLDGPVTGDIHQIDALRNEKLQLTLVAGKKLYVIDRNGNDLSGFPVQLKADPVTGVEVIDYDLSRNYRLMGALADGSVFNYTVDGTPASGWVHQPGSKVQSIVHSKAGNDDVIIMLHDDGSVKCFKRNGQLRYEAKARFDVGAGDDVFCQGALKPEDIEICALDRNSGLVRKRLGSDTPLQNSDVGSDPNLHMKVADLDGDRSGEIILSFSNRLEVFKNNAQSIMRFDASQLLAGPASLAISGKEKGLLVTLADGSIKLIDISGNIRAESNGQSVLPMVAGDLDLDGFVEFIGARGDELYARRIDSN